MRSHVKAHDFADKATYKRVMNVIEEIVLIVDEGLNDIKKNNMMKTIYIINYIMNLIIKLNSIMI